LWLLSCEKEGITQYSAYLKNESGHIIEIIPFRGDTIVSQNVIVLNPLNEKQVAVGYYRGMVGNAGFSSDYFSADSIHVVYDNSYRVTHYFHEPVDFARRFYLYSSNRNLMNYNSFAFTTFDNSNTKRNNVYNYTFNSDDYIYSQ
jgi:hypothetical protein